MRAGSREPGVASEWAGPDLAGERPTPTRLDTTVRVVRVAPLGERLDSPAGSSDTPAMTDPLVAALAQLVRDRWAAELRVRAARRDRLRIVGGRT